MSVKIGAVGLIVLTERLLDMSAEKMALYAATTMTDKIIEGGAAPDGHS